MKHLPIFQELFESDTIIFMIIGMVISLIIGLQLKQQKKPIFAIITSLIIYAICELVSNTHINYMLELILLIFGTVAIGCCIGFIMCLIINVLRKEKK